MANNEPNNDNDVNNYITIKGNEAATILVSLIIDLLEKNYHKSFCLTEMDQFGKFVGRIYKYSLH